ncbi:hypothetical protein J6O48_11580 [bacterium]|nr:hypothetical protein [bacterium]
MKKFLKIIFCIIFISVIILYIGVVFLLPQFVNCKTVQKELSYLVNKKSGVETTISALRLNISPNLVVRLKIDSLNTKYKKVSVLNLKNVSINCKLLQKQLSSVNADNIYIDGDWLKQLPKQKPKKNKKKFSLDNIPEIHISKLIYKSNDININANNIDAVNDTIQLKIAINTPYLKETLRLGDSGSFQIVDNNLKANKFKIILGNSNLYLDGILIDKNKTPNFNINGENLPASEIMATILHLQKLKEHERKYIENFHNFKGTANVNLKYNKDGIWGTCTTNNLSAEAWFDIPLYFKKAVFYFNGQKVDSRAVGTLGKEKVVHTLKITDMLNPQKKLVIGEMNTTLTKKFKYVPNLTIKNSVKVNLVYKLKLRKPDVYYNIDIPEKSDMIYNSFYLGMRDYKRKIYGNTFKDNSDLYLRKYKYSYFTPVKENIIIYGDGLFIKNIDKNDPDRFVPQYLTIRTNGYAPTSIIGAFGEKVKGGEFKGDLKYDFNLNQVLGTFDIIKARHKAFYIDKAHVIARNGILNVTSNGLYKNEKYSAELNAKNNIFGETIIYEMKLFLDKLVFETTPRTKKVKRHMNPEDLTKKVKNAGITINNWEIIINEIKRDTFILKNVKLIGSLKKHIFKFNMKEMNFADGTINANGVYDFAKNISNMTFEAKNINSNKVAEMTLNLKDQIEGTANAKVNLNAKDMFRFIDAHCEFEVNEGFLPKLGDTEFMIKNSKYKLSDVINYDFSKKELMQDDIKGSIDVHNTEINNINITTWHRLSSMYLKGNYEMEKQYADLHLFWHYSKEDQKGVRIFGIPLSWILKVVFRPEHTKGIYRSELSKIPKIDATDKNSNYYRIHLKGDINRNKTKLILKEIK